MNKQRESKKRKYHDLHLDPNYTTKITTEKTQKKWEQKYKTLLKEMHLLKSLKNSTNENQEEGPCPSVQSTGENVFYTNDATDDSSEDEDEDEDCMERIHLNEATHNSDNAEPSNSNFSTPPTNEFEQSEIIDNTVMFEKSGITINDVLEMIVAYNLRFNNSKKARIMLFEMFKICAGNEFKNLNVSNYKISKIFDPPPDKIKFHFYCDNCMHEVLFSSVKKNVKGQSFVCSNCKNVQIMKLSNSNHFLTVDLEYQIRMLLEKDENIKYFMSNQSNKNSTENTNHVMRDINDSSLYKKTVQKYSKTFTYTVSTDGAPLFQVSKRGFWPLQIMLNNLPTHLRFKFILLGGIMVLRTEPKPNLMNAFIGEFAKQANRLHFKGITLKFPNKGIEITIYFTSIFVVADAIARAILQNRLQFNGYFECSYCYHPGKYIQKKGMKYPFLAEESKLRNHELHLQDVKKACDHGSFVNGVKGYSSFIDIQNIDMVWGFPLEYMHNCLLGVAEQSWNDWNCKLLKPAQRKEIDALLMCIEPPHDLQRSTEKISNKSIWKACHWRAWLLFYSIPVCLNFIPTDVLEHFALFVSSLFTLLKLEITETELESCEENLLTFVGKYESLYGTGSITHNVHCVQHLVESVRQSGPLWGTSAFPFEHNIHFYKKTLGGPKNPDQQIATKSLSILKYRVRPPVTEMSTEAKVFCEQVFTSKILTKSAIKKGKVTFLGPHHKNIFESTINKRFERCLYENRTYSSTGYTRTKRFNDTVISLNNGTFLQITSILLLPDNTCSFIVNQLLVEPLKVGTVTLPHIWKVKKNIHHPPVSVSEVHSKCVIDINSVQYVCCVPNTVQAQ